MTAALATLAFVFGAAIGSFASVVAHRVPRGEPFAAGRSQCPSCGAQIAAYDNVPLVSWLVLRGRCRSCGERISARYPLVELGTGLGFAAVTAVHLDAPEGLATGPEAAGLVAGYAFVAVMATVTLADID